MSDKSGQMRLRVRVKIRLPVLFFGVWRDSGPFFVPSLLGQGSADRKTPLVDVPREGRTGRSGLDSGEALRRDVDAQLLIERERGKGCGPNLFHLGVDHSLFGAVRRLRR